MGATRRPRFCVFRTFCFEVSESWPAASLFCLPSRSTAHSGNARVDSFVPISSQDAQLRFFWRSLCWSDFATTPTEIRPPA